MTTEISELTERLRQNRKRKKISDVEAFELGEKERGIIDRESEQLDKPVYKVRPYRGEGGVREAITLLNGMHETAGSPETHAFEIVYDEEILDFRFVPGSGIIGKNLRDQLFEDYPDSTVEQLPEAFPTWDEDEYVAGARMHFFKSTEYPIRHIDIDGFGDEDGGRKNVRDPFKNILTKVTGGSTDVMLQVVFRPSQQGFRYRGKMAKVADRMRAPNTRFLTDYPATDVEKQAADIIENQQNESMYEIEIRVLAASSTKEAAEGRVHSVVHALDEFYESHNRQGFYGTPVGNTTFKSARSDMHSFLSATASRLFEDYTSMKCTASELAGVVHLSGDVNNPHIDYSESRAGIPVPIGTPRFDFARAGLDETATPLERQVAMFNASAAGKPYWIGTGARKGTEAGIHENVFKRHVFVPGSTGYGKTTLLKNLFRQMMDRGVGGMFYDPKGDDAEDVVSLVPEGREDDVIYIELGGNRDKQVGFNFLEVPSSADPDTPAYKEAVEALADDLEALISLAGGEEDYWGPRMKRVVRNMVRGMAKAGYDCTLLDMYFALVSQERREQYAQMLEDERIDWIVEYAREQLADMDDSDLEPLVGRLQQWIENPITRELVSYPKSTFSVEDAIRDGKIIIVEDNTTSETVGTMVATALIRRIWVAVREQSRMGEKPPMFYSILDEFDKIISANSNIARILSLARSKNLSIIGACQDLSNQLDGKEQIQNAILGQCGTILNFNPQRPGEARLMAKRHSEDIGQQDLANLGKYQLYMRTDNEHGEPTKTYKVGTFPPIDEVEDVARTAEDREALIERSLEQYGGDRRTSEDQKRDSKFYDYDETDDDYELTEERETLILKAAYDLALTDDENTDGYVRDERVWEQAKDWMGFDTLRGTQFWGMVDYIPDTRLDRSERDGDMYLKCTPEGRAFFLATGVSSTSGKGNHRELLKDAYDPLTRAGLDVRLPIQTGEEAADGIAKVPFETTVSLRNADEVRAQLEDDYPILFELTDGADVALESESSTGKTQPSQTLVNLGKAVTNGQKCVFLCREKTADTVEGTLTDPPFTAKDGSFYNHSGHPVRINGTTFPRPDGMTETVWHERNDQYVLEDQDGRVYARFDSRDAIFTDASAYPERRLDGDGTGCITRPVIPGEWSADDYEILIVPEDAETPQDIVVRRGGEDIPLVELNRAKKGSSPFTERLDAI
ncbi:type IV secretion system DNA-binding domain-containing protein (plasmid) [Haladaptatus sp. SPP-AMP-3]|uniref:type IV secretory system conjugative DNA transfer family protein n=1 Tax=Haladaptatus sp. SPP-AMP-3 TaxID=3121295 RepID=UPI003C2AE95E